MSTSRPLLLGHRGASAHAPENTRGAFQLALHHGCDGFEFDVRLALDGEAVCCHDADYRGRPLHMSAAAGLELLPFHEALGFTGAFLDIDVKDTGIVCRYAQELRALDPAHAVISSFDPQVVAEALLFAPNIPVGLICNTPEQLADFEHSGAEVLVAHHSIASASLVERVHGWGKRVFVWTVNDPRQMRDLARLGVDAILSDDTQLLGRTFKQMAASA